MMHASTMAQTDRLTKPPAAVQLEKVGVRYRLLTDRDRTLKGRILNGFSRRPTTDREFWALRDIELTAKQGEVVGIIGSNGSGKSTLLRVMARIIHPAEGKASITGALRPLLDVGSTLNPELSGRENAFIFGAINRIPRCQMAELIPRVVEFSELGTFFEVPVKTYSSGMLARLSFALATQTQPDVLLIDEVLSVGDEHFQRKSYFRMMKLIERGSLVIIVSHNLPFIDQVCNRAVLLAGGRIVGDGPPSQIIARYRRTA